MNEVLGGMQAVHPIVLRERARLFMFARSLPSRRGQALIHLIESQNPEMMLSWDLISTTSALCPILGPSSVLDDHQARVSCRVMECPYP